MTIEELRRLAAEGRLPRVDRTHYINNHIHTTYSFSPYTPADAVYTAHMSGLATAGIMDHDTAGGAAEFIEAGALLSMPVTCGVECRVDMKGTPLEGKRLNNPDQVSVAYCAMHGIPHSNLRGVDEFFAPYRERRSERNRRMTEKLNGVLASLGLSLSLDYDRDVLPLAAATVTERHICFALAGKIASLCGSPGATADFLKDRLGIGLTPKVEANIRAGDLTPQFFEYDILGALKSGLVGSFFIPADDELPKLCDFIRTAKKYGAITAYAYLGDVGDSVTGDKKAQKFEDGYLDTLFDVLTEYGFDAVTFMPSRNTAAQLERVMGLCRSHGLFQISGEDINSPRQGFVCRAYDRPEYAHLTDAAFALIAYENAADEDPAAARKIIENEIKKESGKA